MESIAVGSDGRVAVASSAHTGDLWDGRIQLLRCGSGAASAARTATAAPAAPDGAATQLGSIETGVGSCDVAWLSSSLLVCADDRGDVSILRLPPGHEADASPSEVSHSLPIPPPPPTHPPPPPPPPLSPTWQHAQIGELFFAPFLPRCTSRTRVFTFSVSRFERVTPRVSNLRPLDLVFLLRRSPSRRTASTRRR